jgi:hypothetical protein
LQLVWRLPETFFVVSSTNLFPNGLRFGKKTIIPEFSPKTNHFLFFFWMSFLKTNAINSKQKLPLPRTHTKQQQQQS